MTKDMIYRIINQTLYGMGIALFGAGIVLGNLPPADFSEALITITGILLMVMASFGECR